MAKITNEKPMIEIKNVSKFFGPTIALNEVSLEFFGGKITGLIGENGSGKSTLSSIISGMQLSDKGDMLYKGNPHKPKTMIEGSNLGIGMIVQEQGTLPGVTIAQNIFIGKEDKFRKHGIISKKLMYSEANKMLENIGFTGIDSSMYIDVLSMQDRKLVEIARVMSTNPDVLIVDETTTALSQKGRDIIYDIMNRMSADGKVVIIISHDLDELMEVCDTLTVLRDGKIITTLDKEEFDEKAIKHFMVGRDIGDKYYREDNEASRENEVVIDVSNLTIGEGNIMNFSLELYKGEILGIGGLSHCGMHELGKAIFGDMKIIAGEIKHKPTNTVINNTLDAINLGMGYVSKDRDKEALVLNASIRDNLVAPSYDKVNTGSFIFPKKEKEYVDGISKQLLIKCASIDQNVQFLSGGNKQKVVFGKWVGRDCNILVLDCPTRGVDVGVKAAMYQLIEDMKKAGKSIIIISEELTELIGMSDRLLILKDGAISGEFTRGNFSEQGIIECMI